MTLPAVPERVVVLRARMLGEMLCAVPALRALRAGLPDAEITLLGLPWARTLAQRLDHLIDGFIDFPGWPGLPEAACDTQALPDFLAQVQSRRFDLALQMHGSGRITNPLVAAFGAAHSAGFADATAWRPDDDAPLYAAWPERGHETERLLALTDRLGFARRGSELEFPVRDEDRAELARLWPAAVERNYVVVHAGAQLPSRRWPVQRFAAVADRLAELGRTVVLTGGVPEVGLVNALAASMQRHDAVVNLAGRTSLWTLGALIEGAERVVCNDSGLPHVAAALRTPCVVIACGSDVERWAYRAEQQVLWQPMPCRPCSHVQCPIDHRCATAIGVPQVLQRLAVGEARA